MGNKRGVVDEQLKIAEGVTLTASSNLASLLNLGSAYAPESGKSFQACVDISAITTTGDNTYTFRVEDSPDGSTWTKRTPDVAATATGTVYLQGALHANQLRIVMTKGGTATGVDHVRKRVPRPAVADMNGQRPRPPRFPPRVLARAVRWNEPPARAWPEARATN